MLASNRHGDRLLSYTNPNTRQMPVGCQWKRDRLAHVGNKW